MIICNNCGVELEPDMEVCLLCGEAVTSDLFAEGVEVENEKAGLKKQTSFDTRGMSSTQRKSVWELVSIILILLIVATSLINFIINKEISWSEYPVAICLTIFSYVSCFAYLNKRRETQLLCAFITASVCVLALDYLTGSKSWALQLGIPLLFFANMIVTGLLTVIRVSKFRGVNLIAYSFLAVALLCISVEVTTDLYIRSQVNLVWSLIVSACVLPVAVVLFFIHFRLKRGRDLNKTFHI